MNNENEEEKTEEDIDAEAAYQKVTTQKSRNINSNDDNEFEYDENLFNSTDSYCGKPASSVEKDHTDNEHVNEGSINNIDDDLIVKNTIETPTVDSNTEDCTYHDDPSTVQEVSKSLDANCAVEVPRPCEISDGDAGNKNSDPCLPCEEETCEDTASADVVNWRKEHEAATEEWSTVEEIVIAPEASTTDTVSANSEPVSFSEAVEHFQSLNLTEFSEKIRPCIQRTGIAALCHTLIGPVSLSKVLVPERDFIFTLALLKFDNNDEMCPRILYSIYKGLTRIKVDPPRYGKHWENIGFQGNDPTTDLRGCGMLGLLTTLHLITSSKTSTLGSLIYHLSQDEMQHFPFCVMSINVTRISLQILREEKLNKECNKRYKASKQANYQIGDNTGIVYDVFQELFVSIFNRIYLTWKNEYKTMTDSGFVMSDVETYAKKKPVELMRQLKKEKTQSSDAKIQNFVSVDEL